MENFIYNTIDKCNLIWYNICVVLRKGVSMNIVIAVVVVLGLTLSMVGILKLANMNKKDK